MVRTLRLAWRASSRQPQTDLRDDARRRDFNGFREPGLNRAGLSCAMVNEAYPNALGYLVESILTVLTSRATLV
jgi:hypothetical protein